MTTSVTGFFKSQMPKKSPKRVNLRDIAWNAELPVSSKLILIVAVLPGVTGVNAMTGWPVSVYCDWVR